MRMKSPIGGMGESQIFSFPSKLICISFLGILADGFGYPSAKIPEVREIGVWGKGISVSEYQAKQGLEK